MGDKPTCGDCRWCEPDVDGDPPGRCGGGGVAIRVWPDNGACKAVIALAEAERERDEARELVREVGVAGMQLAGEMMTATDGWLVCLRDFGDLHLDCNRAERERDEARGRASNLEREVAKHNRMVMKRIDAINELNAECKRLRTALDEMRERHAGGQ